MAENQKQFVNLRGRRFLPLIAITVFGFAHLLNAEEDLSVRVEPSVDVVPANHLKFYLHFPEPMERGNVFRYLRLVEVDSGGREVAEVPEPFREVELWDETFTRMTLWFHPGRQKPGVNLNVEFGPILEEGRRYRLEVSPKWKTESGEVIKGEPRHEFTAGPLDDKQPNPSGWKLERSKGTLGRWTSAISTDEFLDPESVLKRVQIFVNDEKVVFRIVGKVLYFNHRISGPSEINVEIDPRVEDLAGNSIARPFNLNLEEKPDFKEQIEPVELSFTIPNLFP